MKENSPLDIIPEKTFRINWSLFGDFTPPLAAFLAVSETIEVIFTLS